MDPTVAITNHKDDRPEQKQCYLPHGLTTTFSTRSHRLVSEPLAGLRVQRLILRLIALLKFAASAHGSANSYESCAEKKHCGWFWNNLSLTESEVVNVKHPSTDRRYLSAGQLE
jgi:hypothetical protein